MSSPNRRTHVLVTCIVALTSGCDAASPPGGPRPDPAATPLAAPDPAAIQAIRLRARDNALAGPAFAPKLIAATRGWRADNAAHAFAATFAADGVDVTGRSGGRVHLAGRAIVRGETRTDLATVAPMLAGTRVHYDHAAVREWWTNGPAGLEHGFSLAERPNGDGELALVVAIAAGARALPADDGDVRLALAGGGELRYGGLLVTDAAGATLPAAIDAAGDELRIRFDDRGAVYPIEVDPFVWFASDTLERSDSVPPGDFLRHPQALAVAPDTAVVGFPGTRVEVYRRGGGILSLLFGGPWSSTQVLGPQLDAPSTAFGRGLAIDGATLIVGAGLETPNVDGPFPRGYADVFARDGGGTWTFQTHLDPVPEATLSCHESSFGNDVELQGDTAVIAAYRMGATSCGAGRVFVFQRAAGVWSQTQVIAPPNGHPTNPPAGYPLNFDTNYGSTTALVGDTLVVGQTGRSLTPPLAGAAYVYVRPAPGAAFALQQQIISPEITPGVTYNVADGFGSDVALVRDGVGDLLVVRSTAKVFAFRRSAGVWTPWWQGAIGSGARNSTVVEPGRLIVGVSGDAPGAVTGAGTLRVYRQTATGFTLDGSLAPIAPTTGGGLGRLVAKASATLAGAHASGVDVFHRAYLPPFLWLRALLAD